MSALENAKRRFTSKHYNETKKISDTDLAALREILRLTPSSVNSQPWHFFEATSNEAKTRILPAIMDFNQERVAKSSSVFVFTVRETLTEEFLDHLLEQEIADGRFSKPEAVAGADAGRRFFVRMHRDDRKDGLVWQTHQVYVAMGFILNAAADMGIHSTPIEGMDMDKMDEILGLKEKGLRSVFAISFGYGMENDNNASRPKSRLPLEEVLTVL